MLNMHLENLEETVNERTLELNLVIEELKTTQQYLIQKEKMASLGILSAGIAHEINNPLNFISGGLLLLSEVKNEISTGEAPGEFISKFESANEMIHDGFSKSVEIVNALMSFSVRGNSNLVVADIHAIIENTLLFLNYRIPSGVRIKKDFQLQAKIPLFAEKMNQVIVNIIDNALFEFNHESTSNAEITISTSQLEDYACIKISNNGRKIPEKYLNRIFDPFFTTKDPGQGVGLGLSISYALVHEHSGRIHAENSEDGVVFIIELPMNK
jgi:C4-dicarboxylate-specific signal transduction histidine kinase